MGDTARTVDQSATGGSRSLERAGPQIRQAAAAARKELLRLAGEKLGAPADKLTVQDGVVSLAGAPAKQVSYGELVGGKKFNVRITAKGAAAELKLADDVKPKSVKEYRTVGANVQRFDLPPKLTGEAIYINDLRIPGMLQGRVVRPPVINTEPISIDQDSVRAIPGVVMIVREGKFVGVVAKTEWAAIKAAQALKVTWSPADDQTAGKPRRNLRLPAKNQAHAQHQSGGARQCRRGLEASQEKLRAHLSFSVSIARHDRPVLRHRRREKRPRDHLVRHPGAVPLAQEYRDACSACRKKTCG